ncbi:MAG: HD domain-containing protein [Betaproteobacteria bacterium]|nr:HD domain-containing protein [Betaproteobacteria bacterium]
MQSTDLTSVNPYYLQNVMELTKTHAVVASEDVYDAHGVKLIAQGTLVDNSMQERLVRFKLRQPLERVLTIAGGFDKEALLTEAQVLLDGVSILSPIARNHLGRIPAVLKHVQLDRATTLLVTLAKKGDGSAFRHAILVSLIGLALGTRLDLEESDLLNLAVAGLLHDVGEFYINPEFMDPGRELTPQEWKHIAAHPRIGQLVVEESTDLPKSVSHAIAEHHERTNGFGYPRQLTESQLTRLGRILLTAELLAGIFVTRDPVAERACLALKVIPGEYPREIADLIAELPSTVPPAPEERAINLNMDELAACAVDLEQAINAALAHLDQPMPPCSIATVETLIAQARSRLFMLRTAIHATGLYACQDPQRLVGSGRVDLLLEMDAVMAELKWRLRELSRQIALNSGEVSSDCRGYFDELLTYLRHSRQTL